MNVPNNLMISREVEHHPRVIQIKNKILQYNPSAVISIVDSNRPEYPDATDAAERFHAMKDTLVLCSRRGSFIETFASPGQIVEGPATMVKTLMNCGYKCEFCYLARTAIRQQWQKVYVNLENLEQEMINEIPIHTGVMSLLSAYSAYTAEHLDKIPAGFKELSDEIRDSLSRKGERRVTEDEVYSFIHGNLGDLLLRLECTLSKEKFFDVKKALKLFFDKNRVLPFSFNVSEYSDILGIEHIAGHLDFLMGIIHRNPQMKMHFFTKSANQQALLKHDADLRVKVVMNFNTDFAINNYEHGTPSLSERINALKAIHENGTYMSVVHIEPAFIYPGSEQDYLNLINQIFSVVDLSKIEKVTFGMVRYTGQLMHQIRKLYPDSEILDVHELIAPDYSNDRIRYEFDERVKFYQAMIAEVRKFSNCRINLGAENPEIWNELKLDNRPVTDRVFYQPN